MNGPWRLLLVGLLLLTARGQAAPTLVPPAVPPLLQRELQTPPSLIEAAGTPPRITSLSPAGCIRPGQKLLVHGSHFGGPKGKSLRLIGPQLRLGLPINGWSDSTISATLPGDPRLRAQTYQIGIVRTSRGVWLGQAVPLLRVCPITTSQADNPGLQHLSRGLHLNTSTSVDQAPAPGEKPSPGEITAMPAPSQAPARPGSNPQGTLVGMALPSPPPVLSTGAAPERDVEAGEITLITTDMAAAKAAARQLRPYRMPIKRRYPLAGLGLVMSVFRLPEGISVAAALARLHQDLPGLWLEANHRYRPLADPLHSRQQARILIHWPAAVPDCGRGLRLGMADSGIDTHHPAFQGRAIVQHSVLVHGQSVAPPDHGTAIASLLVGNPRQPGYAGLLPGATLIVAGIFRGPDRQHMDTTSELIFKALDWLAAQQVSVINLSFGGPGDRSLGLAVKRLRQRGIALVAAAGNGGDGPVYPAAFAGVIAVTAVDTQRRRYRDASEGGYIDLAAPGVDLWVARPGGGGSYQSGSSFAAPFVSASAALLLAGDPGRDPLDTLRLTAIDLGAPGRDPLYGYGLLQAPACTMAGSKDGR